MNNNSKKVQARKLKGFQDYLPEVMNQRSFMQQQIRNHAKRSGFQEIATPALEYAEVLLGVGGETDKQVFRFQDNGQRDVALRFDLTVPFARFVAEQQGQLTMPFKRLQIADVWRAEKPQKGRYREFCQCDLDIIGSSSYYADIEIIHCLWGILGSIIPCSFTMALGHRQLLSHLIRRHLGELSPSEETHFLIAIDKLDKIGKDKVIEGLGGHGFSQQSSEILLNQLLATRQQNIDVICQDLFDDLPEASSFHKTLKALNTLTEGCSKQGQIIVDLSIARGLGYYTGIVFECQIDALPQFGSICSGGRYDQLVQRYSRQDLPGVGGSIGLDRLVSALQELPASSLVPQKPGVFVAVASPEELIYAHQISMELRRAGIPCDLPMKEQKLGQQLKTAHRAGVALTLIVGEEERMTQTFTLKIMATGEQKQGCSFASIISIVQASLAG